MTKCEECPLLQDDDYGSMRCGNDHDVVLRDFSRTNGANRMNHIYVSDNCKLIRIVTEGEEDYTPEKIDKF